jgi:hypothetical protein
MLQPESGLLQVTGMVPLCRIPVRATGCQPSQGFRSPLYAIDCKMVNQASRRCCASRQIDGKMHEKTVDPQSGSVYIREYHP